MKLYVWRNGWLGSLVCAMAESPEKAKELIKSCVDVHQDILDLEFANPPEVYETDKAFVVWADVYDLNESNSKV